MKKPVAVLLLLLVCLLSCMVPLRYGLKQAAKVVMHQKMQQDEEQATVLFAASELRTAEWEHAHEFRLDGSMYDVEGVEYHHGLKYYRCVVDELETRMEQGADDLISRMLGHGQHKVQGRVTKALFDWLQSLYFQPLPPTPSCVCLSAPDVFFAAPAVTAEDPLLGRRIVPPEA